MLIKKCDGGTCDTDGCRLCLLLNVIERLAQVHAGMLLVLPQSCPVLHLPNKPAVDLVTTSKRSIHSTIKASAYMRAT